MKNGQGSIKMIRVLIFTRLKMIRANFTRLKMIQVLIFTRLKMIRVLILLVSNDSRPF